MSLHAEVAAKFAAETALWGYKLVRQRRFYWAEKPLLVKRIFRTTNLALWQKHREPGLQSGVAASLGVILNVGKRICVGSVGNISVLLYREGLIAEVTPLDVSAKGAMNRALGFQRLGLKPHLAVETFLSDDVVLMTTDSVMKYVSEDELRVVFDVAGTTVDELNGALVHLIETAKKNGSSQDMSACLMKRIYIYS
jgi:serine/threonine protein phosphatase PrpC